jgi:hypothetical protein
MDLLSQFANDLSKANAISINGTVIIDPKLNPENIHYITGETESDEDWSDNDNDDKNKLVIYARWQNNNYTRSETDITNGDLQNIRYNDNTGEWLVKKFALLHIKLFKVDQITPEK